MITIIDYGMGNLGSILNMFKKINVSAELAHSVAKIEKAEKILLPGVGAFDAAMQRIHDNGFREILDKKALVERIPILGICLGMQLLTNSSEEGKLAGLGWIPARTLRFSFSAEQSLKIPHMGWNHVKEVHTSSLTKDLPKDSRFYFVHTFFVKVENPVHSLMRTEYGIEFDSIIQKENIFGAQFHPEKSHKYGMKLLANFAAL